MLDSRGEWRYNTHMDKVMSYFGMATGLAGSALVASVDLALVGWLLFLSSNVAWLAVAALTRNIPLGIMQAGFMATTIMGIVNNV